MTFLQRKLLVMAGWAFSVLAFGLTFANDKPDLWLLVASLIVIPLMIGHRLWPTPEPTLAQIIARTRRQR